MKTNSSELMSLSCKTANRNAIDSKKTFQNIPAAGPSLNSSRVVMRSARLAARAGPSRRGGRSDDLTTAPTPVRDGPRRSSAVSTPTKTVPVPPNSETGPPEPASGLPSREPTDWLDRQLRPAGSHAAISGLPLSTAAEVTSAQGPCLIH